ncbi:EH signature domain-containing protein [Hoeflea olei]|uniref:Zorya protein ZorC EH domain-containing protein n=1 Tax=Hoeflea olei TaxID=1480615 RepID=A0A1C1YUG1_9HYPH|nr:EH signature domain-containing protein [Hoeflea olei]OCW57067.1 hypothetical protein AWJ14_07910 [Hoeflea olei]
MDQHGEQDRQAGTALRDAIADIGARFARPRGEEVPPSRLEVLAASMSGDATAEKREGRDYDRIADMLLSDLKQNAMLNARRARDGAWCLWETSPAIAAYEPVLERYLRQLEALADKRASRSLCNAYLNQFRPDRPGLQQVSRTLETVSLVAGDPYNGLQRDLQLFSLPQGPDNMGARALRERRTPIELLRSLGVSGAMSLQGGFVEPCVGAALERLVHDRGLRPEARLDFVKALAIDPAKGALLFPRLKALVANALLLPYIEDTPPDDIRAQTLSLLRKAIGDPRSHGAEWRSMEEAARIARRWLTKQSIDHFLEVVDRVALDRMWRWRRKFWNAVFETRGQDGQSIVEEAYVVFDDVGYDRARQMGIEDLTVGRFLRGGGNVQAGQSVLLLRIGRMVIAEWSHNGRVRIWSDAKRDGAPRLYQKSYSAAELKSGRSYYPDWERAHMSPETLSWQDAVADKLYDLIRIRIPQSRYR